MPMIRLFESVGHQVHAMGVAEDARWAVTSALLNYILVAGGQNAANAQLVGAQGMSRTRFPGALSTTWTGLDPADFPFVCSVAGQLRDHDDRQDFLTVIDLILEGVKAY
ncbi:hypothetical protein [Paraburkholderia strydomiana]|uniref:hypothetical protein n=1 Tax=Paraburkholderia strydomiana TaxID=1245417 RepID=UPI00286198D1|nr:hypothetical protein [Paraburkholderia strydomiana]MDR7009869.1 hypothetical protein [Paraburkholderia strydomiana]